MRKKVLLGSIAMFVSLVSSGAFLFAQEAAAGCVGGCW